VIDNVALPLVKVLGKKWREAREIALKQLSQVGLDDKAASFPSQLSGGQQQRVGIARALVMEPDIVLLDEPTSALDPSLVGEVMRVIKRLSSEGRTMVIVTHEVDFARNIATRVLFMKDGSILKDTNPQEFFESASREIRDFLTDLSSIV
jgi:polar amino acid transport system ATP-binding protein